MKVKVLFVCMGNICRSPSAKGVFSYMVETSDLAPYVEVDSAGTHDYHVGRKADERSLAAALKRGIDMATHRARQVSDEDFACYDYILVMDQRNHSHLMRDCPPEYRDKIHYFMDFAPQLNVKEVPDPYYGGEDGFEHVLDLIEAASAGLMSEIRTRFVDPPPVHSEVLD